MRLEPGTLVKCLPIPWQEMNRLAEEYLKTLRDNDYHWNDFSVCKRDLEYYFGRNYVDEIYEVIEYTTFSKSWNILKWDVLAHLKGGGLYPIEYLQVLYEV